ncbi:MAG: gliding motility-associated C-terminal domain-containing protein [Bacteroidia bacterium]|nr:gliding motility-associated C-terminal domain-containing protein [Bacteroidia bacterium]
MKNISNNMRNLNKKITTLLASLLFVGTSLLHAQHSRLHDDAHLHHKNADIFSLPLDFDKDSLQGFNETAAWQQAKMSTDQEWQQKRIVAVLKRSYIDYKYGFKAAVPPPTVQGPCTNPDFETGTLAGWTSEQSPNNNSQTMLPWTSSATSMVSVISATGNDPNIGALLPLNPAGVGNFICRLGSSTTTGGGYSFRATQIFTVTPANSVFIYRYAVALEKTSPHSCSEQPFFNVSFRDCNNNPITCGQYSVTAIGTGCSSGDPSFNTTSNATWAFKPWTTAAFDLTSYIGQCVKLEFTVGGCIISQAGHRGYAYIDASCKPMTLNLNGTDIPVGQTNASICGASTSNTICAPPGFSYNWTGPGVTGQTGQCVNTNSTGTFSVTLGVPGSACSFNPVLYTTFTVAPNPTVTSTVTQPVCALPVGSATINATGGSGTYTYSWTPAAPSASVNSNLPVSTAYTVTATDANGCSGTTTFSVDPYPPAPQFSLNVTPSYTLTCLSPTTNITFVMGSNTTGTWLDPFGTPITNTTVVVNTPGVYTYTTINTVSTCSTTGNINITSSIVNPTLTASVVQPTCTIPFGSATITPNGGTGPYTYNWTPNTVTAPSNDSNGNLPPGSSYTVEVTDALGCKSTQTLTINTFAGAPLYTVTATGTHIDCNTPTVTLTFAPTNTNTSTSWSGPMGVITPTTITTSAAGVYTTVATNTISNCFITNTYTLTIDTVKPTSTYTISCNINTITVNGTATSANTTLNWVAPTSPTTNIGNPASSTATGIYTLVATNIINGCTTNYTTSASVPNINVTTTSNSITCNTPTVQSTITSTATGSNIFLLDGTSTITINPYSITSSGTYTAVVQSASGCINYSVFTIGTNTISNVTITPSSTLITCASGSVSLTASSTSGGPYTYSWTPSSTTGSVITATSSGVYTVTALNTTNGCTATAIQSLSQESINASFNADPYSGEMPLPVSFTNTSTNPAGTNYSWNFGDGTILADNSINLTHTFNSGGEFPVILTAQNGTCMDTAVRIITVDATSKFEVPNVFTPNGDGVNDVFTFNAVNMGEIHLMIYDRWGLLMFDGTANGNIKWDGKNKSGNIVTDGTYFYIIKATGLDSKEYDLKGSVNVFQN